MIKIFLFDDWLPSVMLCLNQRHQSYPGLHLLDQQAPITHKRMRLWALATYNSAHKLITLTILPPLPVPLEKPPVAEQHDADANAEHAVSCSEQNQSQIVSKLSLTKNDHMNCTIADDGVFKGRTNTNMERYQWCHKRLIYVTAHIFWKVDQEKVVHWQDRDT